MIYVVFRLKAVIRIVWSLIWFSNFGNADKAPFRGRFANNCFIEKLDISTTYSLGR